MQSASCEADFHGIERLGLQPFLYAEESQKTNQNYVHFHQLKLGWKKQWSLLDHQTAIWLQLQPWC
jgi:hypothetical protein